MRITSAVLLVSLAFAQAAPSKIINEKRGVFQTLENKLAALVKEAITTIDCDACIAGLEVAKGLAKVSTNWLVDAGQAICTTLKIEDATVCDGLVAEQGPIIANMLLNMDVSGGDGKLLCAAVANICPYPAVTPYNVPFPKPKPANATAPTPSGKTYSVLHLSDWHFDPLYLPGAETECGQPLCCRAESTNFSNVTKPAGKWGDYACDQPLILGQSAVNYIASSFDDLNFAILTGDVPPHNVWETLPVTKVNATESTAYSLLHSTFDPLSVPVFPAVGNHETGPVNDYILNSIDEPAYSQQSFYNSIAALWGSWLSKSALSSVKSNSGSYAIQRPDGLVIISLNTNFCYIENFWMYERTGELDPNGILAWLVAQLQAAEDAGNRVWIIGHIAPGLTDCLRDYSNYYYQVVERYSPHVIAAQFFGHTHRDEFELFYADGNVTASNALSVAYIGPSITTFTNLNPGFRIYQVDTETFDVMDSQTYIANLDQQASWTNSPNWHLEYSARQTYFPHLASTSALSASVWHNLTERFASDGAFFNETYFSFRSKQAGLDGTCDDDCRAKLVCGLQAGKSEMNCDFESSTGFGANNPLKRSKIPKKDKKTKAVKVEQPWEKNLCRLH